MKNTNRISTSFALNSDRSKHKLRTFAIVAIRSSEVEVEFELNRRMNGNNLGRCQNNRYFVECYLHPTTLILVMYGVYMMSPYEN